MRYEERPWGYFDVLYETDLFWVKRIVINPGQSLSYQYHRNRTELWLAETPGVWAEVGGETFELRVGQVSRFILPGQPHRLYNPGQTAVCLVEWATGSPDEADIVRLSDNYGR